MTVTCETRIALQLFRLLIESRNVAIDQYDKQNVPFKFEFRYFFQRSKEISEMAQLLEIRNEQWLSAVQY